MSRATKQAKSDLEQALKTWVNTLEQSTAMSVPEWDAQLSNLQSKQYQLLMDYSNMAEYINAMTDLIKAHLEHYQQQTRWLVDRVNQVTKDRQKSPYHPVESLVLLNPFQTELATLESSVQQFGILVEHLQAETQRLGVQLQQRFHQGRRQYLALVERRFQQIQSGQLESSETDTNDPPHNTHNNHFWGGQ